VGQPKVVSAAHTLGRLNPEVQVQAVAAQADAAWLAEHLHGVDVVLDCTDGFASRQAINQAAWCAGVPLVSAAALRWDGQITVFDAREPTSPCYACLFPPEFPPEETRCALMGVFAPVVGTLGVVQAGEALKVLLRGARADAAPGPQGAWAAHEALTGRLLLLDGRSWRWTELRLKARAGCSVCGAGRPPAMPGA
jgi:molybdopterin/thiamine biosynthesis adenylyltransferase